MTTGSEGRLQDLLSTADRQLASQSYGAAIDTYRTALAELPSDAAADARTDIEGRLVATYRLRGTSMGTAVLQREARDLSAAGRTIEALAVLDLVLAAEPANAEATELRAQLLPPPPEPVAVTAEALPAPMVEPEPPPPEPDTRPIEPPSFHLIEDGPSMLERPRHEYMDEPPLSILDPTPRPEWPDDEVKKWIYAGAITAVLCIAIAVLGRDRYSNRVTPPARTTRAGVTLPAVATRVGVTVPVLRYKVQPEYTEEARQAKIQGTILVYVQIDPQGVPMNLRVIKGLEPGLDARALDAVRKWRFQPGMKDGRPVTVEATVEVNFRLL